MATFAPPVRRDSFLFSSILYADAGNDNNHPRATVAELTALLRPEMPKSNKKLKYPQSPEILRDKPGHWYTAQLLHYGLPPTKDKNKAKVRILEALNERKLEVPPWITSLEAAMKKEWEAENKKLKKSSQTFASPTIARGKKKRGGSELPNVHVAKKAKQNQHIGVTAGSRSLSASQKKIIPYVGPFNLDGDRWSGTRPSTAPDCGVYAISCPEVENDWPGDSIKQLHLAFSATEVGPEWWSRFNWGNFHGILIIERIPRNATTAAGVPFKWRGHYKKRSEIGEGTGTIHFTSSDTFKGAFHSFFGLYSCTFHGEQKHTARKSNSSASASHRYHELYATPVLDRMRMEWAEMEMSRNSFAEGRGNERKRHQKDSFIQRQSANNNTPTIKHGHFPQRATIKTEPQDEDFNSHHNDTEYRQQNVDTGRQSNSYHANYGSSATQDNDDNQYGNDDRTNGYRYDDEYAGSLALSGPYIVICPAITAMFTGSTASEELYLNLLKDAQRDVWWASFSWWSWDCIIQMRPGPRISDLQSLCTLGWRLQDVETGKLTFGRGCTGTMTFFESLTISAILRNVPGLGDVEIGGEKMQGSGQVGKTGEECQAEWDGFVSAVYMR